MTMYHGSQLPCNLPLSNLIFFNGHRNYSSISAHESSALRNVNRSKINFEIKFLPSSIPPIQDSTKKWILCIFTNESICANQGSRSVEDVSQRLDSGDHGAWSSFVEGIWRSFPRRASRKSGMSDLEYAKSLVAQYKVNAQLRQWKGKSWTCVGSTISNQRISMLDYPMYPILSFETARSVLCLEWCVLWNCDWTLRIWGAAYLKRHLNAGEEMEQGLAFQWTWGFLKRLDGEFP